MGLRCPVRSFKPFVLLPSPSEGLSLPLIPDAVHMRLLNERIISEYEWWTKRLMRSHSSQDVGGCRARVGIRYFYTVGNPSAQAFNAEVFIYKIRCGLRLIEGMVGTLKRRTRETAAASRSR